MAFDIPYDQIRELQISLRKEAGLASYIPEDPQLPDLPSLQDAISELDPSPPYLRCKLCKGRLLRVNSVICVFCGRQQSKDPPPEPIKFSSTFAYRWFLQSLDLDGSELVAPSVESNESNRGQRTPEIEVPLSDFLDLEIRWPSEPEKFESSVSEKSPAQWLSTQSLAGVDLDNFFSEAKVDPVSASTEEQFELKKHEDATGSNAFGSQGKVSLFENVKPSEEVPMWSKKDEGGDSFSGWEADFQSAGSGTQQQELKLSDPFMGYSGTGTQQQESQLFDPFAGSYSVDLSSQMDFVFGSGKDLVADKTKENIISASDDWFEGDLWRKSDTGVAVQEDQSEVPVNAKDHRTDGSRDNSSSMNIDWIQADQWQTTTSSNIAADNKTVNEDDDSFDAWNDFTSSTTAQVPSINSLKQDVSGTVLSAEQEPEDLFSGTIKSKDVDFGGFSQQDYFSGTFHNHNGSAEANIMGSGSSVSASMTGSNGIDGESREEVERIEKLSKENSKLKGDAAEMLMSQMHDLSFMLATDLSLPHKKDPQKIDPFSVLSDKD